MIHLIRFNVEVVVETEEQAKLSDMTKSQLIAL